MSTNRQSTHAKTELFCQACAHASPVGGDWLTDDGTAGHRLVCPRCGETVVSRP